MSAHPPTAAEKRTPPHFACGAGFRMPAGRELSTGSAAGVRKPPRKEPAGAGGGFAVYGDLVGRRRGSGARWLGLSASDRRSGSRFGRCGGGRRGEFCLIAGGA